MNFFKTLLASILGTFIGLFLLTLIVTAALISSSTEAEPHIRDNTVLKLDLSGTIQTRTQQDPFQQLFATGRKVTLPMLKENLEKAAADDRITGVWVNINRMGGSWATLETARSYLESFREKSGKFLYASTDDMGMNEAGYFLASAADSIFFPPETMFEFNGFAIQTSYYSEMLEKIGIEPEIVRTGSYKSAVEPFLRTESSEENREQLTAILNGIQETFTDAVGERRGLNREQLDRAMNELPANAVQSARETGLIDGIAYRHELEDHIRERIGLEEEQSVRTVRLQRYNRVSSRSTGLAVPDTDNRIAVVHASGMIVPQAFENPFSSDPLITEQRLRNSLESALDNDQIKAIVLHIESGGGAVSTSELIYDLIRETARKKPVIAYLGSVAASGGYYIAMGADQVIASPNTITGSIGVYNMMFDTSELYNDRLGIYFDTFKTHDHSDMNQMVRPLSDYERNALQQRVESSYERFLEVVAESRSISRNQVDRAGQGRVWTGKDAVGQKLIDTTGTLEDALAAAARVANIDEYRTISYPEEKDFFQLLFQSTDASVRAWVNSLLPDNGEIRQVEEMIRNRAGRNWAVLPVEFHIH